MKKLILLLTTIMFGFVVGLVPAFGAEDNSENKGKGSSTLIILKNDLAKTKEGESYHKQSVTIYCHNGNWFGGGLSATVKPTHDYAEVNPFFTVNKGPLYLLGGLSTNSSGNDYAQAGIWYIDKFGKIATFFILKNYWNIAGESTDYLDAFLELEYPLGKKFYAGIDLDYCHYWQDENHYFYFIGPYAGYKILDNLSVYLRLSRGWNIVEDQSNRTDNIRTGLEISF
ncbi:hypothetical protein KAT36_02980 [Candidatus Pacearchaeota archaeon]|nr:hypothetical protein [Candidatus Pacearchaeota archaeon]